MADKLVVVMADTMVELTVDMLEAMTAGYWVY
jgi:hypothetical protein